MDKTKRTKVAKFSLDGLKEAREGKVSRLDQLEVRSNIYTISKNIVYQRLFFSWMMTTIYTMSLMKTSTLSWSRSVVKLAILSSMMVRIILS